ncbi:MAG: cupin domain-containing protein [Candidatus Geothermarchaeales archaeon]
MRVVNVEDAREFDIEEANKVKVKYLLHSGIGARRLQLRLFTIDVGGYTPLERHAHEHEIFMLEGRALIRGEDEEVEVDRGDAVFISSNELHQIRNIGSEPVRLLCTKETHEIPEVLKEG